MMLMISVEGIRSRVDELYRQSRSILSMMRGYGEQLGTTQSLFAKLTQAMEKAEKAKKVPQTNTQSKTNGKNLPLECVYNTTKA